MRISSPSSQKMLLAERSCSCEEGLQPSSSISCNSAAGHTVRRYDSEPCAEESNRLLNGGVALGLVQAVAARLVERAEGMRVEPCDVVLATKRVVLEDLIGSIEGAATNDTQSTGLSIWEAQSRNWSILTEY
jgi:hypothetical protein